VYSATIDMVDKLAKALGVERARCSNGDEITAAQGVGSSIKRRSSLLRPLINDRA